MSKECMYCMNKVYYMISDDRPPLDERHDVCSSSDHHMISHLIIILWITTSSLTVLSDVKNRDINWSLFCWVTKYEWNSNLTWVLVENHLKMAKIVAKVFFCAFLLFNLTLQAFSVLISVSLFICIFLCTHLASLCNHTVMCLHLQECRPGALPLFLWQRAPELHWSETYRCLP